MPPVNNDPDLKQDCTQAAVPHEHSTFELNPDLRYARHYQHAERQVLLGH